MIVSFIINVLTINNYVAVYLVMTVYAKTYSYIQQLEFFIIAILSYVYFCCMCFGGIIFSIRQRIIILDILQVKY